MTRVLDVLVLSVSIVLGVYVLAFAFTGACLVGSVQPVSECRDNLAGELVYETVAPIVRIERTGAFYRQQRDTVLSEEGQQI